MCGYDPSEHYERHLREQEAAHEAVTAVAGALDPPHAYTHGDVSPEHLATLKAWIERQQDTAREVAHVRSFVDAARSGLTVPRDSYDWRRGTAGELRPGDVLVLHNDEADPLVHRLAMLTKISLRFVPRAPGQEVDLWFRYGEHGEMATWAASTPVEYLRIETGS